MNINYMEFNYLTTSLDVYVAGCKSPHCKGCHNPELWNFDTGYPYDSILNTIIGKKIKYLTGVIDKIMIYGGELFDQYEDDVYKFLKDFYKYGLPIWVFTRYELDMLSKRVLHFVSFLKTGAYIDGSTTVNMYGIELASSNQFIHDLTNK